MAESDFVYAVHNETKVVSQIPRAYLEYFPFFTELTEDDMAAIREEEEHRINGTEPSEPTGEPSLKWTKAQLLEYAAERGIETDSNATKADVLEAISAQEGVN